MTLLHAIIVAAILAGGASEAFLRLEGARHAGQGFITREWTWLSEAGITTFTAYGPAEQVNALDPRVGLLECQDCQLASSVQFEREGEAPRSEVADEPGAGR